MPLPVRATEGAAGYDLVATEDAALKPWQPRMMSTGIRVHIPDQHALLILPRSGFSFRNQIYQPNAVGLIDEDFRGVMQLTMVWMPDPAATLEVEGYQTPAGHRKFRFAHRQDAVFPVAKGDRVAQCMLIEYKDIIWRTDLALSTTARGDGGFGSTGLRAADPGGDTRGQAG